MTAPETVQLGPLPGGKISPSAANAWQICGEKYRRQYILKHPQDPAAALIAGSAFHSGQQYAADEQLRGRRRPDLVKLQDYVGEATGMELIKAQNEAGRKIDWKEGETFEGLRRDAIRGFAFFEQGHGHKLEPLEAEEYGGLEFENRAYRITLKLDVYTRALFVRDYKLTGSSPHATAAASSDQLTAYQAFKESQGQEVRGLALDHVVLNKASERLVIDEVPPRTPEQIAAWLEKMDMIVLAIRAGTFPKANNWKLCSWCGYLRTCHPDWYAIARKGGNGGNGDGA